MDILDQLAMANVLSDAEFRRQVIQEIQALRETKKRRGTLLVQVYNSDAADALPAPLRAQISDELTLRLDGSIGASQAQISQS